VNEQLLIKVLEMILAGDAKSDKSPDRGAVYGYDYIIGKNYFLRTVTHILVGELVHKTDSYLVLKKCSWIADTGRYHDALKTGKLQEVEPYPPELPVRCNRSSFIDDVEWVHDLPTEQKYCNNQ